MGRAKRKDFTVTDELVEKINEDPRYWWQATRHIWDNQLAQLFEEEVAKIHSSSDAYSDNLWMVDELFEKLETQKAEELLITYWNNLSHHPKFIQIAFF